jgi:DNA adenine methylase
VRASTRSTFYCDPPYRGTTGYRTGAWDPAAFDTWCEARARESHEVFVSEFTAPPHWPVVWEKVRRETCSGGTGGDRLDRLYRVVPR